MISEPLRSHGRTCSLGYMSNIIFEENGFPRELSSERDIARAVAAGRLRFDTVVRVLTPDGLSPWRAAADVPELRSYFGLSDEAAAPVQPVSGGGRVEEPQAEQDADRRYDSDHLKSRPKRVPAWSVEPNISSARIASNRAHPGELNRGPVAQSDDVVTMAIMPLRRYADFTGRSRRKEFLSFLLLQFVSVIAITVFVDGGRESREATIGIFVLAALIPNLALCVRRLHDQDRSGWIALLCVIPWIGWLILLIFMCIEGTRGVNRFGADPKQARAGR